MWDEKNKLSLTWRFKEIAGDLLNQSCEFQTINISDCTKEHADRFSKAFNIKGNGFFELESFIAKGFQSKPTLLKAIIKNYTLKTNFKIEQHTFRARAVRMHNTNIQ